MKPPIHLPNLPVDLPVLSIEDFKDDNDVNIEHAHIKDCTLSLDDIRLLECKTVRFTNVQFDALHLENAYFHHVMFDKCTIINGEFNRSAFKHIHFKQCRMNGALFSDSLLEHVQFKECILHLSSFGFSSFKTVLFTQSQLHEADFLEMVFKNVGFNTCDLDKTRFNQTSLKNVDLSTSEFNQLTVSPEAIKGAIVNQTQAWAFLKLLGLKIKEDN